MSDEKKLSELKKSKKPYTPPQLTVYGNVEELTQGTNSKGTRIDAYSQPNRPAKAPAPTPTKKP